MRNPKLALAALAGNMGPGSSPVMPKGPKARVATGGVPDAAPSMNKAKLLLSGVPMALKGRKPRLGGL